MRAQRCSPGGFAIVVVLATVTAAVLTHAADSQRPREPRRRYPSATKPVIETAFCSADLALAIEHIQSIRVHLGISASYLQPPPHRILVNLELVLKQLRNIDQMLSICFAGRELMPVFAQSCSLRAIFSLAATTY
jgi:hypothetical protein